MGKFFLVVKKSSLKGLGSAAVAKFSRPVEILPLYSSVQTRLVYVQEVGTNRVWPTPAYNIVAECNLTDAQERAVLS